MSEWDELGQLLAIHNRQQAGISPESRSNAALREARRAAKCVIDAGHAFDQRQAERHSYGRLWDEVAAA